MSFSGMVKDELSKQISASRHCRIAETAALLSASGRMTEEGNLKLQMENDAVIRKYFTLLRKTFNIETEISIRESSHQKKGQVYYIELSDPEQIAEVLQGTKLVADENNGGMLISGNGLVTQQSCCKRAFIRGAFLAGGSISDPNTSYHLEIVCTTEEQAEGVRDILEMLEVDARVVQRKNTGLSM